MRHRVKMALYSSIDGVTTLLVFIVLPSEAVLSEALKRDNQGNRVVICSPRITIHQRE
jgi:hypothetical protein